MAGAVISSRAGADLVAGLKAWPAWTTLAWNDIQARYRRTLLGPLWLTMGLATTILAMGVIYPRLFGVSAGAYVPFLTTGFVAWFFIVNTVTDSSNIFINAGGMIKQIKIPLSFFVFQQVTKNTIIFLHNVTIYVVVCLLFDIVPTWKLLLAIPALVIYTTTGSALGVILGALGARFRDVPQMVSSAMQIVFFLTPVFWHPEGLGEHSELVVLNPFHHYIEILREPLLGGAVMPLSWAVALGTTGVLCAMAWFVLARFGYRVVFWL